MRLYYVTKDGKSKSIELSEDPLTIGRSADADVLILDEKASRVHCGIRFWDDEFFIKDLKSKNGTFVNNVNIDIHQLRHGDKVRVGTTVLVFEQEAITGPDKAILAMQDAYEGGKVYSTILREIIDETAQPVHSEDTSFDRVPSTRPTESQEPADHSDLSEWETKEGDTELAPEPQNKRGTGTQDGSDSKGGVPPKRKPLKIRVRRPNFESE